MKSLGNNSLFLFTTKELKSYHIVISMPDLVDKRRNVYFIIPYQSWKGKVAKRIEAVNSANNLDFTQLSLPFTDTIDLL